jgi:GNAT superfamily N-acetyltransferase
MSHDWRRGEYVISTDRDRLDFDLMHGFLSTQTYWALNRPLELIRRSVEHSLPFGVYKESAQVGFARVVSDYATFGWLADVFILPSERGQGLSKWLMECILAHPDLQGFRRWLLATKDAHELYRRFGFIELNRPERYMERRDPNSTDQSDYSKPSG